MMVMSLFKKFNISETMLEKNIATYTHTQKENKTNTYFKHMEKFTN